MTADEELGVLEDSLRRLKIEYDIFFGGGSKRPPQDLEWRVQGLLRKYGDSNRLNFAQRFRYNSMAQKYAIFSDLWRQKTRIKEEGYRRPADAVLAIQGLRSQEENQPVPPATQTEPAVAANDRFCIALTDAHDEKAVHLLFDAIRKGQPKNQGAATSFTAFQSFVGSKTEQIKTQYGCTAVEYEVEFNEGKLNLKARPRT